MLLLMQYYSEPQVPTRNAPLQRRRHQSILPLCLWLIFQYLYPVKAWECNVHLKPAE